MSRARQRKADEEERRARENRRQEEFRRHVCAAPDHCFVPTQYPVGLGADVVGPGSALIYHRRSSGWLRPARLARRTRRRWRRERAG